MLKNSKYAFLFVMLIVVSASCVQAQGLQVSSETVLKALKNQTQQIYTQHREQVLESMQKLQDQLQRLTFDKNTGKMSESQYAGQAIEHQLDRQILLSQLEKLRDDNLERLQEAADILLASESYVSDQQKIDALALLGLLDSSRVVEGRMSQENAQRMTEQEKAALSLLELELYNLNSELLIKQAAARKSAIKAQYQARRNELFPQLAALNLFEREKMLQDPDLAWMRDVWDASLRKEKLAISEIDAAVETVRHTLSNR